MKLHGIKSIADARTPVIGGGGPYARKSAAVGSRDIAAGRFAGNGLGGKGRATMGGIGLTGGARFPRRMKRPLLALLAASLLAFAPLAARPAQAQSCGSDYVIKDGDTLAQIAQRVYGNPAHWNVIFYANQDRLGANATLLVPGQPIKLPCIGPAPQHTPASASAPTQPPPGAGPSAAPAGGFVLSNSVGRIEFLTAEGYTPFADRTLEGGGLILDLLAASMKQIEAQTNGAFSYRISWVNDWAAHLNPLLITRAFDAGLPWPKLDCSDLSVLDANSRYQCQKFFFSEPFYEDVTVLFVATGSPIAFETDGEIIGKTLCRTRGSSTLDLNKKGRSWITDNKVVLIQPQTPEDCFRLLDSGAVDAVVISDLTGRAVAASLGMLQRVRATDRPIHIDTIHAIIAKTHPSARTILYYINGSLAKLRESGEYDKIVARHLERFWTGLEERQTPPPDATATASTEKNPSAKP